MMENNNTLILTVPANFSKDGAPIKCWATEVEEDQLVEAYVITPAQQASVTIINTNYGWRIAYAVVGPIQYHMEVGCDVVNDVIVVDADGNDVSEEFCDYILSIKWLSDCIDFFHNPVHITTCPCCGNKIWVAYKSPPPGVRP